ncbi:hypothetical protein [Kordia jejudonensis]|uniref:hypothetical protein n=1 Tax=Kordia jejudonensis TaxID=1348245 RepID=UPI0006294DCE|nr:hypothetical protein [Kordia jejudonensis]
MKKTIHVFFLFFSFITVAQETIPNKVEMCETLTKMIEDDRMYRGKEILRDGTFGRKSTYPQKVIDSVWKLQWKLDNANTEKLIQLTKKYGWMSDERINCPELDIWLIFRHSQKKYYNEIDKIIEKEHTAKRLNDFQYKLIKDHVTGKY